MNAIKPIALKWISGFLFAAIAQLTVADHHQPATGPACEPYSGAAVSAEQCEAIQKKSRERQKYLYELARKFCFGYVRGTEHCRFFGRLFSAPDDMLLFRADTKYPLYINVTLDDSINPNRIAGLGIEGRKAIIQVDLKPLTRGEWAVIKVLTLQ
ncbi:hypothetical protein [Spongorhabdus nitratireducens]